MQQSRCFCEKCNKIQDIEVNSCKESKEFNIGKITYDKLYGKCLVCGNEVSPLNYLKKIKVK